MPSSKNSTSSGSESVELTTSTLIESPRPFANTNGKPDGHPWKSRHRARRAVPRLVVDELPNDAMEPSAGAPNYADEAAFRPPVEGNRLQVVHANRQGAAYRRAGMLCDEPDEPTRTQVAPFHRPDDRSHSQNVWFRAPDDCSNSQAEWFHGAGDCSNRHVGRSHRPGVRANSQAGSSRARRRRAIAMGGKTQCPASAGEAPAESGV